jgi:imidazolonepropionase-like amidohydrolase
MVEAGMPPMKAIQAATLEAARLLRAESDLGSIEKGKLADPRRREARSARRRRALQDVAFVMKGGAIVKRP